MRHQVRRVFYANQQHKQRGLLTAEAVCGQAANVQWRPGVRIANPGEPMNTVNQEGGVCPQCYPQEVRDPVGSPEAVGVGGNSFLQPSLGVEYGQNGDVLGGYSVEGEDQISSDGRQGNVAVVSGAPIKSTELNYGNDHLGGYQSADGLGRPVEVTDPEAIKRLAAEERRRQQH